ncbi:hypothetical protein DFJ73DRAFT_631407 [Zopfochytrium polystomum]|nr:hypothetical protein DFJ73DRAFT_631407 [Zopfochytrium polystomum]
MNRGVAGYVATTGVLVNLPDAYEDPRFDSKTDKSTGYRTQSLLCCPIFGPSKNIVGVAVLLNKIMPKTKAIVPFPATDVELFQGFAAFCGLALHRTLTYEELQRQRQKLAVAIDIMAYHTVAHDDDVQRFAGRPFTIDLLREPFFDPHYFSPTDDRLAATVCRMFNDLGFPSVFSIPSETVSLYVLTVRKNYRPVAYHNFTHAVSVVHGLYMMLSRGLLQPFSFDVVDAFAMFLAALNHDIDHRGTNNAFQKTAATALASFYSSSIMERHHFNHAMSILNTSGLNILDKVPSKDYKRCLSTFEHCILATDLAVYFKTKQAVNDLAAAGNYDSANPEHKNLLLGILMTCTDLSSMYKEWDDVQHTADAVYSEFFAQGHEEKKLGVPISAPVMDPDNEPEIPRLQVGFYASIVTPAYESLCALLGPRADFLLEGVRKNENKWRELMLSGVPYRIGAMHDVSATTTTTNGDHGDGDAGGAS